MLFNDPSESAKHQSVQPNIHTSQEGASEWESERQSFLLDFFNKFFWLIGLFLFSTKIRLKITDYILPIENSLSSKNYQNNYIGDNINKDKYEGFYLLRRQKLAYLCFTLQINILLPISSTRLDLNHSYMVS